MSDDNLNSAATGCGWIGCAVQLISMLFVIYLLFHITELFHTFARVIH